MGNTRDPEKKPMPTLGSNAAKRLCDKFLTPSGPQYEVQRPCGPSAPARGGVSFPIRESVTNPDSPRPTREALLAGSEDSG